MPRVFIAERNSKYVISSAEPFGQFVYISSHNLSPLAIEVTSKEIREALMKEQFDPRQDSILMTGNQIVISMMLAVAAAKYRSVKILLFDSRSSKYVQRVFTLKDETEVEANGNIA